MDDCLLTKKELVQQKQNLNRETKKRVALRSSVRIIVLLEEKREQK